MSGGKSNVRVDHTHRDDILALDYTRQPCASLMRAVSGREIGDVRELDHERQATERRSGGRGRARGGARNGNGVECEDGHGGQDTKERGFNGWLSGCDPGYAQRLPFAGGAVPLAGIQAVRRGRNGMMGADGDGGLPLWTAVNDRVGMRYGSKGRKEDVEERNQKGGYSVVTSEKPQFSPRRSSPTLTL